MPKAPALLLSLVLSVGPAAAQVAPLFDGTKGQPPAFKALDVPVAEGRQLGWTPAQPDQEPGDANPGAPERGGFWDRLQDGAFDQICKNVKLKTSQRLSGDGIGGVGVTVNREMQRTAAGTFAMVDRAGLDLSLGRGQSLLDFDGGALSVSVGASLKGESIVVRPLGTKKSCDELGRLVNITDFKTILPASPERISRMAVGELWRVPLTLHVGVGLGAGGEFSDLPAHISLGRGEEGRVAATLYRLGERQLRLRMRIDRASIHTKGGEVVYSIPGAALGFPEVDVIIVEQLVKLVNRQVAKTLTRYLTARLGAANTKRTGRMLLVEYILDPQDQAEMQALRGLLRGDLNALVLMRELLGRAGRAVNGDPGAAADAAEVVERHSERLGREPTFVGADDYERDHSNFRIKLPILLDNQWASGRERDRVLILDEGGMTHEILKADKIRGSGFLDVPFLGEVHKHNTQRTAQVITSRDKDGNTSGPAAVFLRQEGFLRSNSVAAREMAEEADAIASLIGVRGEGRNARTALPVDELFPKDSLMLPPRRSHNPHDAFDGPRAKDYHRGLSAFTLVFNQRAVADIVSAPVDVVVKSYVNALGYAERAMMERVMPHVKVGADGELSYKDRDALRALGYHSWHDEAARGAMSELARLAAEVTNVLRDLAKARDAATPEERAARFRDVMAGDGRSGLEHEEILKVLVQLVDPADVSGEFFVNVEKRRKGEKDVQARLILNDKAPGTELIAEASRNRARFAEPSILLD